MKNKDRWIKRGITVLLSILILAVLIAGALQWNKLNIQKHADEALSEQKPVTSAPEAEKPEHKGPRTITIYSVDRQLRDIINQYAAEHWNFPYQINFYADETVYSASDIINISRDKLVHDPGSLDLCCVLSYADDFIKGDLSEQISTYRELGIDVDADLKKAELPQYLIEKGSNPKGELVALPYLANVSVFVYRRSVAKEVWGTDDPGKITDIIGGGTESWERFKQAALTLKEHGYDIVPGFSDLYAADPSYSLSSDGKINSDLEEYMDVSKFLYDNGCIKDTITWTDPWYKDLKGTGDQIFGFTTLTDMYQYLDLGDTSGDWAICMPPYPMVDDYLTGALVNKNSPNIDILGPFIEWLTLDSSEKGLQYRLASGTFLKEKLTVLSGTVLKNADSSRDLLGGQNINPMIYEALNQPAGQFGFINNTKKLPSWLDAIKAYLWGGKDKETLLEGYNAARRNTPPGKLEQ